MHRRTRQPVQPPPDTWHVFIHALNVALRSSSAGPVGLPPRIYSHVPVSFIISENETGAIPISLSSTWCVQLI